METSTPTGESEQSAGSAAREAPSRFRLPFRTPPQQQPQPQAQAQQQQKVGRAGGCELSQMQLAHMGYFNRK